MSFVIESYWKYLKRDYYKSYLTQKKIRSLPIDDIRKIQWTRLKNLLDYVYNNNDYYKNYFESVGLHPADIQSASDFVKLPITTKEDYIKNFKKIVTRDITKGDYVVATTSGSTGEPFMHYMDVKRGITNTVMAFMLNMESMGIKSFEKKNELMILFRPKNEIVDFTKIPKKKWMSRLIYSFFPESFNIRGYTITKENTPYLVALIKDHDIKGIYGIASSVLNLAQFIDDTNVLKLNYIITIGEGLLDYQRQYISQIFNCPVFMDYGNSECMRMGFECKNQHGFHMDIYNYYFEFLRDEHSFGTNESYDLVVTDLNNYVFPFIRYKTSDAIIPLEIPCTCGNNLPMVMQIIGKSIVGFTAPNGYRLSSVDFGAFFEHYHKHTKAVKQFQVIQKDEKTILIKIVPTEVFTEAIGKDIENKMSDLVSGSMKIIVIPVNSIKSEKTGKTKVVVLKNEADNY